MASSNRIILAEHLGEVQAFDLGALPTVTRRKNDSGIGSSTRFGERFSAPPQPSARPAPAPDPLRQAFEQGFARGAAEAQRAMAQKQAAEAAAGANTLASRLDSIAMGFEAELCALESQTADRVVDLALEIARRVLIHELRTAREAIVPVAREALAALAASQSAAVMYVHPSDLPVVRDTLEPLLHKRHVELVADARITPGGCRIDSADSQVDATLQTRWARTLAGIGRHPTEEEFAPLDEAMAGEVS
jgi:flagellar assembly protein FliH